MSSSKEGLKIAQDNLLCKVTPKPAWGCCQGDQLSGQSASSNPTFPGSTRAAAGWASRLLGAQGGEVKPQCLPGIVRNGPQHWGKNVFLWKKLLGKRRHLQSPKAETPARALEQNRGTNHFIPSSWRILPSFPCCGLRKQLPNAGSKLPSLFQG